LLRDAFAVQRFGWVLAIELHEVSDRSCKLGPRKEYAYDEDIDVSDRENSGRGGLSEA
jgi:hypothetical protein